MFRHGIEYWPLRDFLQFDACITRVKAVSSEVFPVYLICLLHSLVHSHTWFHPPRKLQTSTVFRRTSSLPITMSLSKQILKIRCLKASSRSSGNSLCLIPDRRLISTIAWMWRNQLIKSFSMSRTWLLEKRILQSSVCFLTRSWFDYRSLYSNALKTDQVFGEQNIDINQKSERATYSLSGTLPAGSKASFKVSFKGRLTGSMAGYYKSAYEKDGQTRYYALTQFEVSMQLLHRD